MAATIIKNGRIHDAVHREAYVADILLADGKIAAIGGGLTAPADAAVFDADGWRFIPVLSMPTPISASMATASGTRAATTTR